MLSSNQIAEITATLSDFRANRENYGLRANTTAELVEILAAETEAEQAAAVAAYDVAATKAAVAEAEEAAQAEWALLDLWRTHNPDLVVTQADGRKVIALEADPVDMADLVRMIREGGEDVRQETGDLGYEVTETVAQAWAMVFDWREDSSDTVAVDLLTGEVSA